MTRQECMLKLLAHGSLTFKECVEITGWPSNEVFKTLRALVEAKVLKAVGRWNRTYFLCHRPV